MTNKQAGKMLLIIIIFLLPVIPLILLSDVNWLFLILFIIYLTSILLMFKFLGDKISNWIIGKDKSE